MQPLDPRWYDAIKKRRSRRLFDPVIPIEQTTLENLSSFCLTFRPFAAARCKLVTHRPDSVFKGVAGSYGKITGARAFIAFIGNMQDSNVQEQMGYTGEAIILEATALGLSTCWVGGFFDSKVASTLTDIGPGERVLGVTPVGYTQQEPSLMEKLMTGFGRTHKRLPLVQMITGLAETEWPQWVKPALEAARLAPSAVDRQPWGFDVQSDSVIVSVRTSGPEFNVSKRLDCGIAMLHLELGAQSVGIRGDWQFLQGPKVARFSPR